MSFWPFPKTVLSELRAGQVIGRALEVGSGNGELARRLSTEGIQLLRSDLRLPAELCANACALPIVDGGLGVCVGANLVRHLRAVTRRQFLAEAGRTLAPGGRLALLEDRPAAHTPAEQNYRSALELLREVVPGRGAAVDLDPVLPLLEPDFGAPVFDGFIQNEEIVRDPHAPLRWLAAHGLAADARLVALERAVTRSGMSYGEFRVCVWERGRN